MKKTNILFIDNNWNKPFPIEQNLVITKDLNSVLIGLILGDAGVYKTSSTSNARIELSFGQKYKSFAEHLAFIFFTKSKKYKIKGFYV